MGRVRDFFARLPLLDVRTTADLANIAFWEAEVERREAILEEIEETDNTPTIVNGRIAKCPYWDAVFAYQKAIHEHRKAIGYYGDDLNY